MHQPVFDYLRTKKTIGYIVSARPWDRNGSYGIAISASSNVRRFTIEYVEEMIRESISLLARKFKTLTDVEFEASKASYVKFLAKQAPSLSAKFMNNERKFIYRTYQFDEEQLQSNELKTLTREDFVKFFEGHF